MKQGTTFLKKIGMLQEFNEWRDKQDFGNLKIKSYFTDDMYMPMCPSCGEERKILIRELGRDITCPDCGEEEYWINPNERVRLYKRYPRGAYSARCPKCNAYLIDGLWFEGAPGHPGTFECPECGHRGTQRELI